MSELAPPDTSALLGGDPFGDTQAMKSQRIAASALNHSLTRDKSDARVKPFVYLVAITASLGGLVFGYDVGGSGGTFVMDGFKSQFGWDTASEQRITKDEALIAALMGVGEIIGAILAPFIFNSRGRKSTMFYGSAIFTIGAIIQAAAVNMPMLYVPRILAGAGVGMLAMCVPVYISEVAPESHRGSLSTLWHLATTAGVLLVSLLNIPLSEWSDGWRISYGGGIVFSIALMALLTIMPESPHFLIAKGRQNEAREALAKVRFEDQIEWEMEELEMEAHESKERGEATWSEVFDNGNNNMKTRVFTGMMLQLFQQLTGINAISTYSAKILEKFFGSKKALYGDLALKAVLFLSSFITIFTIEKFGRVLFLFAGALMMCAMLIVVGILCSLEASLGVGVAVTIICALYFVGYSSTWGAVVWTICAEMFPMRERGKATSLTTATNYLLGTISAAVFPIASAASLVGCFGFFAAIMFVAAIYVYAYLPESANRTIAEIDQEYATHKPQFPRKKWV